MATVLDIIQGALLNLNSYAPGEPLDANTTNVGLSLLNDLFDSYSTDRDFVWSQNETVFTWTSGKYQYSVGNYTGGTFTGSVTSGVLAIQAALVPSTLVVGSGVSGLSGALQAGTTVTQIGVPITFTGAPLAGATSATLSSVWAYPTTTSNVTFSDGEVRGVTLTNGATTATWTIGLIAGVSAAATVSGMLLLSLAPTATTVADTITFTVPGDIPIQRPLRFRNGYTRATTSGNSNLDFYFEFKSYEEYKRELLKNIPGPWPYIAAYRPDFPLGQLFVYPSPGANYTAHLFSDLILQSATNTSAVFSMPQGYTRAFKKLLALEFAPVLMKPVSNELRRQAKEAKDLIKALNAAPVEPLQYDTAISRASSNDAGWIVGGGFV
jgi:hypothetical protein